MKKLAAAFGRLFSGPLHFCARQCAKPHPRSPRSLRAAFRAPSLAKESSHYPIVRRGMRDRSCGAVVLRLLRQLPRMIVVPVGTSPSDSPM